MSFPADHSVKPSDDQATRLRELVARMDRVRDANLPQPSGSRSRRTAPNERIEAAVEPRRAARVIAIASGKGGVGKTSLSVNLCAVMAQRGSRVVLLDGDFGLANADLLCGVRVGVHLGHVLDGSRRLDEALIETPAGFRLAPGASGLASLLQSTPQARSAMVDQLAALETACDLVVIDCGAGMGEGVFAFLQAADAPVVVTTPEPTAIADAYALIKRLMHSQKSDSGPRMAPRLIINMCRDERDAHRAHQRIAVVARRFMNIELPLFGWLPMDAAVGEAVRARRPFVHMAPRSEASRALKQLAQAFEAETGLDWGRMRRSGGFWRRLFGSSGLEKYSCSEFTEAATESGRNR